MAGPQLLDALEHRLRRHHAPEGEGLGKAERVESPRQRRIAGEERLDLAREPQAAAALAQMQRLDAVAVAREHQRAVARVPQRDGELAIEARERPLAPGLVGAHDDLGVAACRESVPQRSELGAQLDVIEDLAVEHHPQLPVRAAERLLSGERIDDREARVREPGARIAVQPELVRAAVAQSRGHRLQRLERRRWQAFAQGDYTGDAAHASNAPW